LAQTLIDYVGGSAEHLFAWLGQANQTTYAQLAPLVLRHGPDDAAASAILHDAGKEIAQVATALDARGELPLALCGGLADALRPWLPDDLNKRAIAPRGDSTTGALRLIQERVHG
jgi:glucosamine kinase